MTAPSTNDVEQRRAARRRRLQQRQTVIFGGLITVLLVIGLVAAAMWSGLLPAPFTREFSSEEPTEQQIQQPCLPEGAVPLELASITANVYNGTDRSGLAAATGSALGQVGVLVNQQANWPGGSYPGVVQIVAGPIGVTAAYSLARLFPGSVVTLESTRADESVDVVLGGGYEAMLAADEIAALDPAAPLTAPEDCTPVTQPTAGEPTEAPAQG
ncbi:LytR C-terminal domain-containing protein [Georgenia subflava]|uniref:LytR family transcriptional regulator n=1 Tax=Georgenia subflava TaxID=1622177 RepID=A0A6N7EJV2_9MICO|nr:LytR C-terminal domain-containing protein [Georgenia subflava]MPV37047.1 LytR family transcriptional regulator [Georgenia subflava]